MAVKNPAISRRFAEGIRSRRHRADNKGPRVGVMNAVAVNTGKNFMVSSGADYETLIGADLYLLG